MTLAIGAAVGHNRLMTNANKTERPALRTVLDRRTAEFTAFSTYGEMTAACATGYVPTISGAASWLGFWLETDGYKVFWRS